jgi:hypothetical protein
VPGLPAFTSAKVSHRSGHLHARADGGADLKPPSLASIASLGYLGRPIAPPYLPGHSPQTRFEDQPELIGLVPTWCHPIASGHPATDGPVWGLEMAGLDSGPSMPASQGRPLHRVLGSQQGACC